LIVLSDDDTLDVRDDPVTGLLDRWHAAPLRGPASPPTRARPPDVSRDGTSRCQEGFPLRQPRRRLLAAAQTVMSAPIPPITPRNTSPPANAARPSPPKIAATSRAIPPSA